MRAIVSELFLDTEAIPTSQIFWIKHVVYRATAMLVEDRAYYIHVGRHGSMPRLKSPSDAHAQAGQDSEFHPVKMQPSD